MSDKKLLEFRDLWRDDDSRETYTISLINSSFIIRTRKHDSELIIKSDNLSVLREVFYLLKHDKDFRMATSRDGYMDEVYSFRANTERFKERFNIHVSSNYLTNVEVDNLYNRIKDIVNSELDTVLKELVKCKGGEK